MWDCHAMKLYYFSPSLLHYIVIKMLMEKGAVHLTNTWKFKHHAIKMPTVTPTDRIVQATRQLTAAIQDASDPLLDELEAIDHLRALRATGSTP